MKNQDKEFQGRSLDEAIAAACSYFDLPREKLEIDILSDAKAGIFGLVGSRKASIMARPAPTLEGFSMSLQMSKDTPKEGREDRNGGESRDSRPRRDGGARSGAPRGGESGLKHGHESERRGAAPKAPEVSEERPEGLEAGDSACESQRDARAPQADKNREQSAPQGQRAGASSRERGRGGERRGRSEREERGNRAEREERGGRGERNERGRSRRDGRDVPDGDTPREASRDVGNENGRRGRIDLRDRRSRQPERGTARRENRENREDPRQNRTLSQAARLEKDAENEDLDNDQRIAYEGLPEIPLAELPADKLLAISREVMEQTLRPLCPEAGLTVTLGDERVDVTVDCGDEAALLIGREGQTLAAMQYLLTRIVGRTMGAAVNMHLDIGDYRKRQDDKLRELALILAERVRESGRAQFTRPLSSYHRRIVHMALQAEGDLITRSKGEGALKRVSVALRGGAGGQGRRRYEPAPEKLEFVDEPDAETFTSAGVDAWEDQESDFAPETDADAAFHRGDDTGDETATPKDGDDSAR